MAGTALGTLVVRAVALALFAAAPGLHAQPPARVARIGVLYTSVSRIDQQSLLARADAWSSESTRLHERGRP